MKHFSDLDSWQFFAPRHAIWGLYWLAHTCSAVTMRDEKRGRAYKLYEQFCNRAERPNCFAPSASRMCYRWMASGRGNVETRERLGGKLHYTTPRRVVIYVATATHLNRGTKMFVGSIYSLSSLFPFPLAQRTYSIPGTIDMCIRARTGILYTKFSTGLIVATGPCVILLKYFIVFLRNPTERNYHKFNLLHWGETAHAILVILLTPETRNLCTCSVLHYTASVPIASLRRHFVKPERSNVTARSSRRRRPPTAAIRKFPPVCSPLSMSVSCKKCTRFRLSFRRGLQF